MSVLVEYCLILMFCVVLSQQQTCSILYNKDIPALDLPPSYGQPQANCCGICSRTPGCTGFAWNTHEGGTCWLKSGTAPVVDMLGVNVGILSQPQAQTCNIQYNKDITALDLPPSYGQPQSNCCGICSRTPGCKGFAWNSHEGGTCWLKSGTGPIVDKLGVNVGILGSTNITPGTNNGALITFDEFSNGVANSNGYPRPTLAQYNAFIQGLPKGQITSKQEAAMALTQFLHESDGLRAKREYRCKDSGCPGEYTVATCGAAGQYYYGRGYIQLSWCYNYRDASMDLFGDSRLVNDPDMVARDENLAWNSAFWFWKVNVHNKLGVAEGDFGVTTRAINGGLECDNWSGHYLAKKRYEMYGRVRAAFGLPGPGNERGCYN